MTKSRGLHTKGGADGDLASKPELPYGTPSCVISRLNIIDSEIQGGLDRRGAGLAVNALDFGRTGIQISTGTALLEDRESGSTADTRSVNRGPH